jgi:hypothetical protein
MPAAYTTNGNPYQSETDSVEDSHRGLLLLVVRRSFLGFAPFLDFAPRTTGS